MKRPCMAALVLGSLTGLASAQVTFDTIGSGFATDVSNDGSVVVGNTVGEYETFWWTAATGIIPLGRATVPVIGVGAGTPEVSDDGMSVSATIIDATSTYATQGLWTMSAGWQDLIPPTLPDGGIMDSSYGSAWGMSGDGLTVVGLYWRPGQPGGSAHACSWSQSTGLVDLGAGPSSSRANDANYDGSVVVGWESTATGTWQPVVWVNGVQTILTDVIVNGQADAVTPDGTMVVGMSIELPYQPWYTREAAIWRWTGTIWEEELLGNLPGTNGPYGYSIAGDVTADGSMVVGYNRLTDPWNATGFIWTESDGLVDVEQFLIDHGIVVDPDFDLRSLSAVTDDGTIMVGTGQQVVEPYDYKSFIIGVCAANADGHDGDEDGDIDLGDLALLQRCFTDAGAGAVPPGCAPFDTDCDLDVDLTDYADFASGFNGPQ
ncbi:MAG: hypothetical protein GY778_20380 [bacterium]|nr:hypothetical protein [bacterium]